MKDNKAGIGQYIPLIFLLLGLGLAVVSYLYGYQAFNEKTNTINDEIKVLDERYNNLKKLYDNKKQFEEDKEKKDAEYEKLLGEYDADVTDESVIMDLFNAQNEHKLHISNITISQKVPVYSFGQLASVNPNNPQISGINSSFIGSEKEYTIQGEAAYDSVKAFMDDLQNTTRKRRVPTTVTLRYDDEDRIVKFNYTVKEYAISGDGLEPLDVNIPTKEHGNENIFDVGVVYVEE
ncbi:MAG: hypothetical protein IJC76_07515 [Lachnospiraceae bacterium]|nr:hypothetical protein [Lachnospiraceae bacterium]